MNILIANTFYYPHMNGGAEQSVKLLAEGLAQRGHNVGVFCVDNERGKKDEDFLFNGVHVFRRSTHDFDLYKFSYGKKQLGKIEKIRQKLMTYYNKKIVADFADVCDCFQPDIVHTNSMYGMTKLIWKEAHRKGIPTIHTIRDISIVSPVQYGHKANSVLRYLHRIYTNYTSSFVDGVTAPSEYTLKTSFAGGAFHNVFIQKHIFNSVSVDLNEVRHIIEVRKKRTDKCIKFMFAGRLTSFKGVRQMIEAFERMNAHNCELHICGGGDMEEYVRNHSAVNPRIIYHGKLTSEELEKVYKECDILILPSVWPEPFGRVYIEGNKYGMPVIAGDCGGIPEIQQVMHAGVLCDCNDIEALKIEMVRMTERQTYQQYFDAIISNIDIFNLDRQIDAFEDVYASCLNREKGSRC